ncbi:MAG TPA: cation transporter [Devosiaceae bacterium]|jgi:Co/Zn/Cd efflux system component|nr:cation transporter [Devosiaceae bacterium]
MSAHCCGHHTEPPKPEVGRGYRAALWIVLAINAAMFLVEIGAGLLSGSAALQADALDFFGDAANYGISLFVVGMAMSARSWAALAKAASMLVFGLWVLGIAAWHLAGGTLPEAHTMGIVGVSALLANAASFGVLWRFRAGDSNMRSAWICTRNDVLGNFAVLLAALGVFGTGSGWPDVIVATLMAALAIQGAATVLPQALGELRSARSASA